MKPLYAKTQDTRLAGLERRVRFLERREQLPNPHTDDDLGGGGSGIMFDTAPQEGGFLEATATTGSITFQTTGGFGADINLDSSENVNLQGQGINIISDGGGAIILQSTGAGDIVLTTAAGDNINLQIGSGAVLKITGLPTSAPGVSNAVWNDSGTLKIT